MVFTVKKSQSVDLKQIRTEIRNLQPQIVEWRRKLHQKPELGFQEQITAKFIASKLEAWGIEHQTNIAKTGIVATIPGKSPGKVLAIRADMDALPIQEANEVPYKSQHDGKMHACGHDGHTAIALATAYYLSQHQNDFSGTVKIIFQPAEEGSTVSKGSWEKVASFPSCSSILTTIMSSSLNSKPFSFSSSFLILYMFFSETNERKSIKLIPTPFRFSIQSVSLNITLT